MPSIGLEVSAIPYPTFRTPASICFSEANDVFVPSLIVVASAGVILRNCASAEPIMARSTQGHGRSAQKAAAIMVDFFGHIFSLPLDSKQVVKRRFPCIRDASQSISAAI
jgi:hypothetical protein